MLHWLQYYIISYQLLKVRAKNRCIYFASVAGRGLGNLYFHSLNHILLLSQDGFGSVSQLYSCCLIDVGLRLVIVGVVR